MKTRRLFFALWPTDEVRHSIVEKFSQLPQSFQGRRILPHNLHVTLHFLGARSVDEKDCMHRAAQTIKAGSFEYRLDCYGFFPKAKILWMGSREAPPGLSLLHNNLAGLIEKCGYADEKRAYAPHLTLMKKCVNPVTDQSHFSIPWFIDEFVLLESCIDKDGVNYQLIEKYPLS